MTRPVRTKTIAKRVAEALRTGIWQGQEVPTDTVYRIICEWGVQCREAIVRGECVEVPAIGTLRTKERSYPVRFRTGEIGKPVRRYIVLLKPYERTRKRLRREIETKLREDAAEAVRRTQPAENKDQQ